MCRCQQAIRVISIKAYTFKLSLQKISNVRITVVIIHQIFSLGCDWSKLITWPNSTNIRGQYPIFKPARVAKQIWRITNTIVSIWREIMLAHLSLNIICLSNLTVFLELRSPKTVRLSEQIMSANNYIRASFCAKWRLVYLFIFSPQSTHKVN